MNEEQIRKRIAFAQNHIVDRMWRRTFFLDEASFQVSGFKKFCYQQPNKRITKPQVKHPPKIHIIGMISYFGPTRLIVFQHNLDGLSFAGYLEILAKDAYNLFHDGNFRIYYDRDPKHT